MNLDEINELLKIAARYDRRTIGRGDLEAFYASLSWAGLTEASAAVIQHYTDTDAFLMPSHVVTRIRQARARSAEIQASARAIADARQLPAEPPRQIADALAEVRLQQARNAQSVRCPHCHAQPGRPCQRIGAEPGKRPAGGAHPSRRELAERRPAA